MARVRNGDINGNIYLLNFMGVFYTQSVIFTTHKLKNSKVVFILKIDTLSLTDQCSFPLICT